MLFSDAEIKEIAEEALGAVNRQWDDVLSELDLTYEDTLDGNLTNAQQNDLDACELYLYIRPNGYWVIDGASYYTGGPTVAAVSIGHYESADDLASAIEVAMDWDAVQAYAWEADAEAPTAYS